MNSEKNAEQQLCGLRSVCEINIKKNTVMKMLAAVLSTSLLLSSCGAGANETDTNNLSLGHDGINAQAATYGAQSNENDISNDNIVKNTTGSANESGETKNKNSETVLPPNMTMDDLLNMIQINGKTLTLHTTLNKISEYDDFTFETEFVDENHMLYSGDKVLMVYVMKNDIRILTLCYFCDEDKIEKVLDEPVTRIVLHKAECEQAGVYVDIKNDINFYSTNEQIRAAFGTPNIADDSADMYYKFHSEGDIYILRFGFNSRTHIIPEMFFEIKFCYE